jgi:hypothetical protein
MCVCVCGYRFFFVFGECMPMQTLMHTLIYRCIRVHSAVTTLKKYDTHGEEALAAIHTAIAHNPHVAEPHAGMDWCALAVCSEEQYGG